MGKKLPSRKDVRGDNFFSNKNPQPYPLASINRAIAHDSTVSFCNRSQAMSISKFPRKVSRTSGWDLRWQKRFLQGTHSTHWLFQNMPTLLTPGIRIVSRSEHLTHPPPFGGGGRTQPHHTKRHPKSLEPDLTVFSNQWEICCPWWSEEIRVQRKKLRLHNSSETTPRPRCNIGSMETENSHLL